MHLHITFRVNNSKAEKKKQSLKNLGQRKQLDCQIERTKCTMQPKAKTPDDKKLEESS